MSASRSTSQRRLSLAIARASPRSLCVRPLAIARSAISSVSPRRSTASSIRNAAVRAASPCTFAFAIGAPLSAIAPGRQRAHLAGMKRATTRPEPFAKPAHWPNDPPPTPAEAEVDEPLSPTRYGDWERKGVAVDF